MTEQSQKPLAPWPMVTVWGILGGPHTTPWVRPANDDDLKRLGVDKSTLLPPTTEGYWA